MHLSIVTTAPIPGYNGDVRRVWFIEVCYLPGYGIKSQQRGVTFQCTSPLLKYKETPHSGTVITNIPVFFMQTPG